jgi:hypothetical protein
VALSLALSPINGAMTVGPTYNVRVGEPVMLF